MQESRRTFLKAVGAATMVAGAGPAVHAMDPIKRRGGSQMHLSLVAYSFRHYLTDYHDGGAQAKRGTMTMEDFIDVCAEFGLPGTELTSYYLPDPLPALHLQRLRKRALLAGLTISGTAVGNSFTHPPGAERDKQIAYTKLWIDRAADMGAPTIRIFAGELHKGTTELQARQWCLDAIRTCCDYAGKKGVILALENHFGIVPTAEKLISIVREVDSEWFGITWDSGNFRSEDPYAELVQIAPYAVTAQIKVKMTLPGNRRVPADLPRVVQILRDANYRGWLALEYADDEDAKTAVPRYLDELRRLTAPAHAATARSASEGLRQ